MGRRLKRARKEFVLVLILALLSAGIVSASVAAGLIEGGRRTIGGPVAVLPEVLFSPAPARAQKVVPVAAGIQNEIDAQSPGPEISPVGDIMASPSPSPKKSPSPTSPSPSPSPSASPSQTGRTAMALTMTQMYYDAGDGKRKITYEMHVNNTGQSPLQNIFLTSHVPGQTSWNNDGASGCPSNELPLIVQYDAGRSDTVCVGGGPTIQGSSDPGTHPVTIRLSNPVAPGHTVRVEFTVDLNSDASGTITNHCHADSNGLSVTTDEAVTPLP